MTPKPKRKLTDRRRAAIYATRPDVPEIVNFSANRAYRWGCLAGYLAGLRAGRRENR